MSQFAGRNTATHNDRIIDQFTRQAVPFAQKHEHSNEQAMNLTLDLLALAKSDRVLDVACGPGLMTCAFAPLAGWVTGIDLTPAMIEQARRRAIEQNLTNVSWDIGDGSALPFADGSFSVVFSRYAFHHLQDPARVLTEMARVCAPGGRVVVADVYAISEAQGAAFDQVETWRDPSHVRTLSFDELRAMFRQAGLEAPREATYRLEMELEAQLRASFPNPGDEARIRAAMVADVDGELTGFNPRRAGNEIRFSYPVVIMAGGKP